MLGTIYERLGDLVRSTEALDRALKNKAIKQNERAEAYSLLARNFKTRWRNEWEGKPPEERAATALRSPHLQESFENYERAFDEDLNHYYSGLNALAMIKIMVALAEALPEVWAENFTTDKKAEEALDEHREHAAKLVAAVELSLKAIFRRLEREDKKDVWAEISEADLRCLTTAAPLRVAAAYRKALASAPDFASGSVRKQLAIYRDLGVLGINLAEVFKVVGEPPPLPAPGGQPAAAPQRQRVLLFAGHMIDAPDRAKPRFPADKEPVARARIKEAVLKEMTTGAGVLSGYAGGASGGDILFHEVCAELGIPTRLYLAIPPQKYVTTSVQQARAQWVERFWRLYNEHQAQKQVRVLSDATDEREYLPAWLREKPDYSIWQRNNLWMLFNALDEGCDPKTEDPNVTLIALWDGEGGDGPGGTGDLVKKVEDLGARSEIIKTKELFEASITASATLMPAVPGKSIAAPAEKGVTGLSQTLDNPAGSVSRYDFFIAYATPDRQKAQALTWFLQDASRKVFLDVKDLSPGVLWQPALREALEASRAIVVLVSTHADDAFYQQEEIVRAIQLARDKPRAHIVIPVILEKLPQGAVSMPYGMSSLQAHDATRAGGLERVAAELVALLNDH